MRVCVFLTRMDKNYLSVFHSDLKVWKLKIEDRIERLELKMKTSVKFFPSSAILNVPLLVSGETYGESIGIQLKIVGIIFTTVRPAFSARKNYTLENSISKPRTNFASMHIFISDAKLPFSRIDKNSLFDFHQAFRFKHLEIKQVCMCVKSRRKFRDYNSK